MHPVSFCVMLELLLSSLLLPLAGQIPLVPAQFVPADDRSADPPEDGINDSHPVMKQTTFEIPDEVWNNTHHYLPVCTLTLTPTLNPASSLSLRFENGKEYLYPLPVFSQKTTRITQDGTPETVEIPDSLVTIPQGIQIFAIPRMQCYPMARRQILLKDLSAFPKASKRPLSFGFRKSSTGMDVWINGSFAGIIPNLTPLRSIRVSTSEKRVSSIKFTLNRGMNLPGSDNSLILSMDFVQKKQTNLHASLNVHFETIKTMDSSQKRVPLLWITDGFKYGTAGLESSLLSDSDRLAYQNRNAWDAMPESLHFSVPRRRYARVFILCSVFPGEFHDSPPLSSKAPVLVARLTRFDGEKNCNPVSDHPVSLSTQNDEPTTGRKIQRAGSATYTSASGKRWIAPLYLVEIPLNLAPIQELFKNSNQDSTGNPNHLDFELFQKQSSRDNVPADERIFIFAATLDGDAEEGNRQVVRP